MVQSLRFTFGKEERLCSRKIIDDLFINGKSFNDFPFRALWMVSPLPSGQPLQVVFIVPKRNFKKAVDRNRIKRQMREIFRHHKHLLAETCQEVNKQVALVLIFNGKNRLLYSGMESKIIII